MNSRLPGGAHLGIITNGSPGRLALFDKMMEGRLTVDGSPYQVSRIMNTAGDRCVEEL